MFDGNGAFCALTVGSGSRNEDSLMELEDWKKYRSAVWTKARDTEKVPKGAVSGVSMGDSIDAVAKAIPKGLSAIREALSKLESQTKKYKAGIGKKHPKLVKWIEGNLEVEITTLDAACKATIQILKKAPKDLEQILDKYKATIPDIERFMAANEKAKKNKTDWLSAVKGDLALFATAAKICEIGAKTAAAAATEIKVEVPGKPSSVASYRDIADRFLKARDALLAKSQMTTFVDLVNDARNQDVPDGRGTYSFAEYAEETAKEQGAL